jgi:hypothetical protein
MENIFFINRLLVKQFSYLNPRLGRQPSWRPRCPRDPPGPGGRATWVEGHQHHWRPCITLGCNEAGVLLWILLRLPRPSFFFLSFFLSSLSEFSLSLACQLPTISCGPPRSQISPWRYPPPSSLFCFKMHWIFGLNFNVFPLGFRVVLFLKFPLLIRILGWYSMQC